MTLPNENADGKSTGKKKTVKMTQSAVNYFALTTQSKAARVYLENVPPIKKISRCP